MAMSYTAIIVIPVAAVLISCNHRPNNNNEYKLLNQKIIDGISIPGEAKNVLFYEEHWQETVQLIRFNVSCEKARRFSREQLGLIPEAGVSPLFENDHSTIEWWLHKMSSDIEGARGYKDDIAVKVAVLPHKNECTVWVKLLK